MANHATARDPDPKAPTAAEQLVGRVLEGRYRIEAQLGEGGLGTVYRAQHLKLAREVAIKVLREEVRAISQLRARFEREARALSSLTHPNIVTITDFGSEEGLPFLVMELAQGRELAKLIGEPIPPSRALSIMRQILASLAYAHDREVIHRDLKPSNVIVRDLIDGREHVTVLDFGLAKFVGDADSGADLTRSGLVVGTPAYMPPEQIASGAAKADARSDLYSAGLILFEMLTGRRPFVLAEPAELLRAHLVLPPPSLSEVMGRTVNPELEDLIARALTKSPDERFQTAKAMIDAIDALPPEPLIALTGSRAMPPRRNEPPTPVPLESTAEGPALNAPRKRGSIVRTIVVAAFAVGIAAPLIYFFAFPDRTSDSPLSAELESAIESPSSAENPRPNSERTPNPPSTQDSRPRVAPVDPASPRTPALSAESARSETASTPTEEHDEEPSTEEPNQAESLVASMTESLSDLVNDVLPDGLTSGDDDAVEEAPAPSNDEESEAEARIDALEERPVSAEVVPAPEADETPTPPSPTQRVRPRPRNPLRGRLPPILRRVHARISRGNDISNRLLQQLTYYRNDNPRDVRTRLVLGHVYMHRGWFTEAVTQFEHAASIDLSVRGDPDMLDSLIRAARTSAVYERASSAIVSIYGREARGELRRAIDRTPRDAEKRRLSRILQRVGG